MVEDKSTCILSSSTYQCFSSRENQRTHNLSGGPGMGWVSEARARESIDTLTACQGIRDGFGQRGSSSTEHRHTHILSRDQGWVRSARFELDRASTHSHTVKGSGTGSVSEARARQSINTLTPSCQGIRAVVCQQGLSSIEHRHSLSVNVSTMS
ncbi:hypothetical protein BD769DRAFT_674871 [Suillus cothurnatus]|nr:hypothetical protein BD769DRAFT_674871 [Suillus cothurnatus]